tara:strand:- start:10 stop:543 length:534 start_codon:yes stop_codon:yes gene_type:complete
MSITSVTSESLQLKLRQLLPSQQGFGTDLSASDTIIPIIDLTEAAEGSDVAVNLQTALAHGSQTPFEVSNAYNTTILSNTGFWRVIGTTTLVADGSAHETNFEIFDGATRVKIYNKELPAATTGFCAQSEYDFIIYLNAGDSLEASSSDANTFTTGSIRQIADINGTLVNPSGFTPS